MKSKCFSFLFNVLVIFTLCIAQQIDYKSYEGPYNIIIKNNYMRQNDDAVEFMKDQVNFMVNSYKTSFKYITSLEEFGKEHESEGEAMYIYKVIEIGKDIWFKAYLNDYLAEIIKNDKFVLSCEPDKHFDVSRKKNTQYKCRSEVKGYPCCPPEITEIYMVDTDGDWGFDEKTNNWCGFTPYFETTLTYM
ncbi:hypothetical protein H8356DRAFT_1701550 [Neocallimastix lanati (nom. inval.)]|jgi:hypothetical protein|uniref:CBM10 domain-containing protein n=1 Tax=Neocallimastix californiae TaxID=1754190 RepID=A0A1Y2ACL5_9FUNG|nr:hypothetical protein H8356DRAFT_1701550 [Neocallimastix sp. JGI-2020a]ORY20214.1 hypothetical protein LY90DRAFT_707952 [Neocallimastix californiae]|eukprot:ORY20214.1 hypothetical protein LY90DRAFT_707952 [Neocallimastix californiae]